MKRNDFEKHLRKHGCALFREGGRHSIFINELNRKTAAVPRHEEIDKITARKICDVLEIERPTSN